MRKLFEAYFPDDCMVHEGRSPTHRVVSAVARETNRDPLEMPPLYHVLGGKSLEQCLEELDEEYLTFSYVGVSVTVSRTRSVQITREPETAAVSENSSPEAAD